jgi:predicted Zn finger-like uncharacterized protein
MMITCSNCQAKIRVPDSAAGKKGKCPKCASVITIPAAGEPSGDDVPAPAEEAAGSPFDFSDPAAAPAKKGKAAVDEEVVEEGGDDVSKKPKKGEQTGLSLTSMILGIVSLVCSCFSVGSCFVAPLPFLCAVAAIVLGFIGMKKGGKNMAITGICCGGGSILLTIVLTIVSFFLSAILSAIGIGAGAMGR